MPVKKTSKRKRRGEARWHKELIASLPEGWYEEQLARQGGTCALPSCVSKPGTRRLHIDTCHRTRTVRGLLCFRHNVQLRDYMTPQLLREMADYLEEHEHPG